MRRAFPAALAVAAVFPFAAFADATPNPAPDSAVPLSADQLDEISAGQSIPAALTSQSLNAVSTGNQVNAGVVQSGQVTFANGAFSGFTGIGNFVVNTGNNNVLQGNLSVTIVPLP